jgi:hypothetical protein
VCASAGAAAVARNGEERKEMKSDRKRKEMEWKGERKKYLKKIIYFIYVI